jgi:hypothetical protein
MLPGKLPSKSGEGASAMGDRAHVPDGLPVLARGKHLAPEDGVCVMEYASILAGERFSDRPRCTDLGLALLAQMVNDAVSDGGRHLLAPVAADLSVLGPGDAVTSAQVVVAAVVQAGTVAGGGGRLERAERRARRRLRTVTRRSPAGRWARGTARLHLHGAGRHRLVTAVDAVAHMRWRDPLDRDRALLSLLEVAMREVAAARPAAKAEGGAVSLDAIR